MSTHTPFNGDHYIGEEIRRLCGRFKIQTIVETGTWSAHSSREFAKIVPHVITIDPTDEHLIEEFGEKYGETFPENLRFIKADSAKVLERVLGGQGDKETRRQGDKEISLSLPLLVSPSLHPVLLYLDAHGGGANGSNVNPIMEELDAIAKVKQCLDRCVICVHDVQVPGRAWGYNGGDWGRGFQPLSYELFKEKITRIYPLGHVAHHNDQAVGARRGILYVYPAGK